MAPVSNFAVEVTDFVPRWRKIDFTREKNIKINGRETFRDKRALKKIYKDFLTQVIKDWRAKKKIEKPDASIPVLKVKCSWKPVNGNPDVCKFFVVMLRKKGTGGTPTDPKTPPPPNQQPPAP